MTLTTPPGNFKWSRVSYVWVIWCLE